MDRICVVEPGYLPQVGQPLQCMVEVGASADRFEQAASHAVIQCVAVAAAVGFVVGWLWADAAFRFFRGRA